MRLPPVLGIGRFKYMQAMCREAAFTSRSDKAILPLHQGYPIKTLSKMEYRNKNNQQSNQTVAQESHTALQSQVRKQVSLQFNSPKREKSTLKDQDHRTHANTQFPYGYSSSRTQSKTQITFLNKW